MTDEGFFYDLVLSDDQKSITNVLAYQERPGQSLRAVMWSDTAHRWIYAPAIVADVLYDDSDPMTTQPADRATAERAASAALQAQLPAESALIALCEEGERMGWRYGPPGP